MKNKKVLINAMVYVANNIFVKAFQFFLVPVYTAVLSTEEYGISGVLSSFTSVVGILMTLSIGSANLRMYTDYKNEPEKARRFFGSIYLFCVLFGTISVSLLFLFRDLLTHWFLGDIDFFPLAALALASLWLGNFSGQYSSMLNAMQEAKESAAINVVAFLANILLNILFVVVMDLKLNGIYYSSLIVGVCRCFYGLYRIHRRKLVTWCIDWGMIKQSLKYSIPLIPHSLSSTISQYLSKLIIGNTHSLATVGIYSLAGQFGHIIDTVQSAVHSAYLPWFFELRKENSPESVKKVRQLLPVLLDIYSTFFLGIALFSFEAVYIMADEAYHGAWTLVAIFVCIYAIKTPYYFYSAFLFYAKEKTRFIFLASISSNMANIIASSLLIPIWGMYGSVVGDLVGVVVLMVIILFMVHGENSEYFRMSLFLKNNAKLFAFMIIGLSPSFLFFDNELSLVNISYKVVVWGTFAAIFLLKHKGDLLEVVNNIKNHRRKLK